MKPHSLDGLAGEMRDHIARETRENVERGMAPDEARRAAVLAFGNLATTQEDVRAVWIPPWLEHFAQDLRYAVRSVTRNPLFSLIVVGTLAITIGLSTAVLGPFYSVLLRTLDYPHAERLVALRISNPDLPADQDIATNQEFWALLGRAESLDKLVAYTSYDQTLAVGASVSRVRVASVSDDFWSITNAQPIAGRLPLPNERNVVVLSEPLYATAFGADPRMLGHTVLLDRVQVTIVGVIAPAFRFQFPVPDRPGVSPREIELYRSLLVSPPTRNFAQLLSIVGRLKPGIDFAEAAAELTTTRVARPFSRNDALTSIRIEPAAERLVRRARLPLNVLLTAVGFVLLIGCANIANLLLARATVRQKEIAIRVSVGAGRARVLRQFLLESAIYSTIGGAAGLLLARWSLSTLIGIFPQALPRLAEARIGGTVIAAMAAVLLLVTVIFGLVPMLAVSRSNTPAVLKEGATTITAPPPRIKMRSMLAGAQLALAVALASGAGLLVKSFWRMNDRPPGFDPAHILSMRVDFPSQTTNRARREYATRLLASVRSLPTVEAVSLNTHSDSLTRMDIVGEPESDPGSAPPIFENQTSAEFARVMGLQVIRGRWLTDDEPRPVVVLNETLARLKFGQRDPIGQSIQGPDFGEPGDTIGREPDFQSEVATVVGVVADLRYSKLDEERTPELYVPYYRTPGMFRVTLVIKTSGDPVAIVPSLRTAVSQLGTSEVPFDITTLDRALSGSIAPRRLNLIVLMIFAATAMLLALVGIYGVMAYSVSQLTHELGIRSALGAARRDVIGMVIWQGVRVAAVGIAIGVGGALALTHVMSSLLFQVDPTDPPTFAAAALMLGLTAVLASAIPALRAGAVDPLIALKE